VKVKESVIEKNCCCWLVWKGSVIKSHFLMWQDGVNETKVNIN